MGKKYEPLPIDKLNLGNYVNCNSFELICQYSVDFSCIKIVSTIKVGHSILAIRTLNFFRFTWCVMCVFIKHTKNISPTPPKKLKTSNLPNSKNDLRFNLAVLKKSFHWQPWFQQFRHFRKIEVYNLFLGGVGGEGSKYDEN